MSAEDTNEVSKVQKEKKCENLSDLLIGDHIVCALNDTNYCHLIATQKDDRQIEVVYYDDGKVQECFGDYLTELDQQVGYGLDKPRVMRAAIELTTQGKMDVFRMQYDEVGEKCLKPEDTIKKAKSFLHSKKYNVFVNTDEHFASYCKTGKAGKLFVLQPEDVTVKAMLGSSVSDKIKNNLTSTGTNLLLVSTAKHIATKFPRNAAATTLPVVAEAAGTVICVVVEGISMTYDIHKKYKENKSGQLETLKFKKYIAKRVTRGTFGVAGGIGGAVIGQMVIPIPVLGAVVGGFVGGLLGSALGHGQGILIGEIVGKVDEKVKEKRAENEERIRNQRFEVLNELVLPFNGAKEETKEKRESDFLMLSFDKSDDNLQPKHLSVNECSELLESLRDTIEKKEYDLFVLTHNDEKPEVFEDEDRNLNFLVQIPKEH